MLTLYVNGVTPVTFKKFPAGETLVRIEDKAVAGTAQRALIRMDYESNEDIINLLLLVDAVRRRYGPDTLSLSMPYLPYARQDRVCSKGESLSVKVIADLINSCEFSAVLCKDIHSEVGAALLNNLHHVEQDEAAYALTEISMFGRNNCVLVSPDAGANKKVQKFAQKYGYPHVVRADKLREVSTGNILETIVYSSHIGHSSFLIVDDICDGGRTFIELAKVLRPLTFGGIYLYVTHGIFSAGADVFGNYLDGIYTANLMNKAIAENINQTIIHQL